jgi:hypothetical protein
MVAEEMYFCPGRRTSAWNRPPSAAAHTPIRPLGRLALLRVLIWNISDRNSVSTGSTGVGVHSGNSLDLFESGRGCDPIGVCHPS